MRRFLLDGLVAVNGHVAPDAAVECLPDGVVLWHAATGARAFIPTDRPPGPGGKVTALDDLAPVFASPLVVRRSAGGGCLGTGTALARRVGAENAEGAVHLVNSGTGTPEVDDSCARAGVGCDSLGRQPVPGNLVIPGPDRIIVRSPVRAAADRLDDRQRGVVHRLSGRAEAVVSVSSKDAALTTGIVGSCNGAHCYFQPTGGLTAELTLLLLQRAQEGVANLAEWRGVAHGGGLAVPDVAEGSPEAPEAAAALLRALHRRHWAGAEAAVCTLGRHGSVVADWVLGRVYHVRVELADGDPGVPTPDGTGDRFLGEWVYWRESWSRRGHLRDPLAVTAVRASHAVAGYLGLRRERYDVGFRVC